MYSYDCIFTNDNNIGAIYPKSKNFTDYTEALAYAVVSANIPLLPEEVGNFIIDSGYIQRRKSNIIDEIIIKAQSMINRGSV